LSGEAGGSRRQGRSTAAHQTMRRRGAALLGPGRRAQRPKQERSRRPPGARLHHIIFCFLPDPSDGCQVLFCAISGLAGPDWAASGAGRVDGRAARSGRCGSRRRVSASWCSAWRIGRTNRSHATHCICGCRRRHPHRKIATVQVEPVVWSSSMTSRRDNAAAGSDRHSFWRLPRWTAATLPLVVVLWTLIAPLAGPVAPRLSGPHVGTASGPISGADTHRDGDRRLLRSPAEHVILAARERPLGPIGSPPDPHTNVAFVAPPSATRLAAASEVLTGVDHRVVVRRALRVGDPRAPPTAGGPLRRIA
jgi:hypothetical protein